MHIRKIRLTNFRNFTDVTVWFSKGPNLILGNNGEGKTNLLEAIHLLGLGRSHRERKDANLMKLGTGHYRVEGQFLSKDLNWIIEVGFDGDRKVIKVNGKEAKPTELIGLVGIVVSAPDDIDIIKGSPSLRRSFIDIAISQIDREYLITLQRYQRILNQRNTLLRSSQIRPDLGREIRTWDNKLIEAGSILIEKRIEYIRLLTPIFERNLRTVAERSLRASVVYVPKGYRLDQRVDEALRKELERLRDFEIARGYTLAGPHSDDLCFSVDGKDLRVFGSEGEQRSAVIALKCAEADLLISQVHRPPILLLDDVFAELDERRSEAVGALISKFDQIILTSSREAEVTWGALNVIRIKEGSVIQDGGARECGEYSRTFDPEDGHKCSH
ncbi:MAG: DNA replication/repair protein RecF [bacterium]